MAKKKVEVEEELTLPNEGCGSCEVQKPTILPITQVFGNGDMNTLRDKINEIIKSL